MSDTEFNTVDDLFKQASLKERALAAAEEARRARRVAFDSEVAELRSDFDAWAMTELGLRDDDLGTAHLIIAYHDEAANEALVTYRVDSITLRCYYKREVIMKGGSAHAGSDNPKEFSNPDLIDLNFVVEVKRHGNWVRIKTLADLGEQIKLGGVWG